MNYILTPKCLLGDLEVYKVVHAIMCRQVHNFWKLKAIFYRKMLPNNTQCISNTMILCLYYNIFLRLRISSRISMWHMIYYYPMTPIQYKCMLLVSQMRKISGTSTTKDPHTLHLKPQKTAVIINTPAHIQLFFTIATIFSTVLQYGQRFSQQFN